MAARPLDGCSILILEDEYLIAMDIEQICLDAGAINASIVSGAERLGDALLESGFDGAILDLRLAGVSTLDFARMLYGRDTPFIFTTGYADRAELARDFPGVEVVTKPYAGEDIVQKLAAAIGRARREPAGGSGEGA